MQSFFFNYSQTCYIITSPKEEILQLSTILNGQPYTGVINGWTVRHIQVLQLEATWPLASQGSGQVYCVHHWTT